MKPVNLTLAESDLAALDTLAPRLGIVRLRGKGDRSAVVRALIRRAMAEGCPPEAPGDVARCCIGCGHRWTGPLDCPECGEPGEPVDDGRQGPPVY